MSRRVSTALWLAAPLAVAGRFWLPSYADGPGGRDVPPEVIARAEVARQNMQRIVQAIWVYMNDHADEPPPSLSALYPDPIADPRVFWHPGDSDPAPTTIDNDLPNAPNSARISYEVDLALFRQSCPGEQPWIRDNTAANNGGWFVNELYLCNEWYTVPAGRMPTPSRTALAASHLRALVQALHVYSNDNCDGWPTDLMQLVPCAGPPCAPARVFWHPGDDQPMPTRITSAALNELESAQISFEYLVAGLNENHGHPDLPCFRDNSPANNGGCGVLVGLLGGAVVFEPLCAGDLTGDLVVDFADYLRLAGHFGPAQAPCDGDYDIDGDVDMQDVAVLQMRFGAACEPRAAGRVDGTSARQDAAGAPGADVARRPG